MTFMGDTGFHPTVVFDAPYWVHDFTRPSSEAWTAPYLYSVGRYDERRPEMYTTELFAGVRDHHVGLDLGAPAGTPVFAFASGEVACVTINGEDGSYGPTLVTKHTLAMPQEVGREPVGEVQTFWVLYGHLSWASIEHWSVGDVFEGGTKIAALGDEEENGGWPPHVHVQLSRKEPENGDLPGVVAPEDRQDALALYPDPRLICGALY